MTPEEKAVVDAVLIACDTGKLWPMWSGDLLKAVYALRESREPKPRYSMSLAANISGPDGGGRWDVYDGPQRIAHSWDELQALRIRDALNYYGKLLP